MAREAAHMESLAQCTEKCEQDSSSVICSAKTGKLFLDTNHFQSVTNRDEEK